MQVLSGMRSMLAAVLFASAAAAAPQRAEATGLVIDADGKPLAGATVTFLGAPLPIVDAYDNVDRVEARSGDDGRFQAQLLRHADYSAWAAEPRRRGHAAAVSSVRHFVAAGDVLTLHVREQPHMASVRLSGLDAWSKSAPFTIAVAPCLPVVAPQPVTLKGDEAELPPFPGSWHVYVRDVHGVLVHAQTVEKAEDGVAEMKLPPPRSMNVRAVDEAGAAVAGAAVSIWRGSLLRVPTDVAGAVYPSVWQPVGTTGSDGMLALTVGDEEDALLVVARAAGHRPAAAGWFGGGWKPDAAAPKPRDDDELPLLLRTGDGLVAHWMVGRKVLARAVPGVAVRATPGTNRDWQLAADPRGSWLPDIGPDGPVRAVASMPAGSGVIPAIAWIDPSARRELRVVDLATLRLHAPAGIAPGTNLRVLVQPFTKVPQPGVVPATTTLSVTLPAMLRLGVGQWRLLASDGEGLALHELDLLPGATDLHLAMQPLAERRGRLLADGGAQLGAMFRCPASPRRERDELPVLLEPFEQPAVATALPVLPSDLAWAMASWLAARGTVRADGSFAVKMLRCYEPRLPFSVESGGRSAELPAFVQRRSP